MRAPTCILCEQPHHAFIKYTQRGGSLQSHTLCSVSAQHCWPAQPEQQHLLGNLVVQQEAACIGQRAGEGLGISGGAHPSQIHNRPPCAPQHPPPSHVFFCAVHAPARFKLHMLQPVSAREPGEAAWGATAPGCVSRPGAGSKGAPAARAMRLVNDLTNPAVVSCLFARGCTTRCVKSSSSSAQHQPHRMGRDWMHEVDVRRAAEAVRQSSRGRQTSPVTRPPNCSTMAACAVRSACSCSRIIQSQKQGMREAVHAKCTGLLIGCS